MLADDVCERLTPPIAAGLELRRNIHAGAEVLGDRNLLERALSNLIANALQHSKSRAVVEVQVRVDGERAVLAVLDDGPGLPPHIRARLFQRYATGRADAGNGLGLALVARVARLHDARLTVSAPDTAHRIEMTFKRILEM
jgi:signal transduction histidine kinase